MNSGLRGENPGLSFLGEIREDCHRHAPSSGHSVQARVCVCPRVYTYKIYIHIHIDRRLNASRYYSPWHHESAKSYRNIECDFSVALGAERERERETRFKEFVVHTDVHSCQTLPHTFDIPVATHGLYVVHVYLWQSKKEKKKKPRNT